MLTIDKETWKVVHISYQGIVHSLRVVAFSDSAYQN